MLFKQSITAQPFTQWLVGDTENKWLFRFSLIVIIASFGWLKLVYPYPNFLQPDSMWYLNAALKNDFINYWPTGYSKFIRLVSVFTRSHLVLVVVQYLLLMSSVLYLLFTLRYLLPSDKWLFRSLFAISIINPIIPHVANIVSSDALFACLSLVWFTQLLWIAFRPGRRLLLVHAVILLLAFMVRFSAIWYPFISIAAILLAGIPKRNKWVGVASIVTGLLIFIGCTGYEYYKRTNTIQYAAFGGWQMAANALYAYAYAEPIDPANVPARFHDLHTEVNRQIDSLHQLVDRPDEEIGVYYLWNIQSPLITYTFQQHRKDRIKKKQFEQWAFMGPLFGAYGRWLITQHPGLFIQHFALPNLARFYQPPVTSLDLYNVGNNTVDSVTVTWFNWKNNQLPYRLHDPRIHIMSLYPPALAVINTLFLVSTLIFLGFSGLKQCTATHKRIFFFVWLVWLCNVVFSVVSAPTELRYQIFPVIITIPFCIFILSWLIQASQSAASPSSEKAIPN